MSILEAIDMDSYRVEKQAAQRVQLVDQDVEIDPVSTDGGGIRRTLNSTGCPISSAGSTICSGTLPGRTATASGN